MGKQSEGEVLPEMEDKQRHTQLDAILQQIDDAWTRENEKLKLIRKYNPPVFGVASFLFKQLTNEQIIEVGERYRAKGTYTYIELLTELLRITGHEKCIGDGSSVAKEFTLVDLGNVEMHLNQYREEEVNHWIKVLGDGGEKLQKKIQKLEVSVSNKKQLIAGLVKMLKPLKKFDKTKYDRTIFDAATMRYQHATKLNKHYGKCLLEELKERKLVKDGFEDTEEFWDMYKAYKQYRSNKKVRSSLPKK